MKEKKSISMKVSVLLLAMVILIGCTIGGTLAWLQDTTGTVTNTFTVGKVDIEIAEYGAKEDGDNYTKDDYKILPGTSQEKKATVTVNAGSEACWVFVKITESNNYIKDDEGDYTSNKYIDWTADRNGEWKLLFSDPNEGAATVTHVYYIDQEAATKDVKYDILTDNQVSYSSNLTMEQLEALGIIEPTLTFQAYAIQKTKSNTETFTAEEAWAKFSE